MIGYAIGLTIGFFQMLYLDYKLDKNFKNQLQRFDKMIDKADLLNNKTIEIQKKLEIINSRLQ